jgi:hypothetical protein
MEPFNINIGYGDNAVTLTILPMAEHHYKVIYYGAIIGAVKYQSDSWDVIQAEDLEAGDLPFYQHDANSDKVDVILNEATVDEIGEEIDGILHVKDDVLRVEEEL